MNVKLYCDSIVTIMAQHQISSRINPDSIKSGCYKKINIKLYTNSSN